MAGVGTLVERYQLQPTQRMTSGRISPFFYFERSDQTHKERIKLHLGRKIRGGEEREKERDRIYRVLVNVIADDVRKQDECLARLPVCTRNKVKCS